jgi:hypothetical protein
MTVPMEELEEMTPRQLGHLIENASDALYKHSDATETMRAQADVSAEIGNRIVAIDGNRVNYGSSEDS